MPEPIIRPLEPAEMPEIMYHLTSYAFNPTPPWPDKARRLELLSKRQEATYMALFAGDTAVSVAASTPMSQQVRGKIFNMGGIWGVATRPEARRQGYCRRVLTELLTAVRDSGCAFTTLYPFRESFYERLGYTTFPLPIKARFNPANLAPLLKMDLPGHVETALIGEVYPAYHLFLQQLQRQTHGMAIMKANLQRGPNQPDGLWVAQAVVDGRVQGMMLYDIKGAEVTQFTLRAIRFYAASPAGRYLLLDWIARHIDQANLAELWLSPTDRPETWLADLAVSTESMNRAPMGRVLDVAQMGGQQVGDGRFTAAIHDPLCPWNEGNWEFVGENGRLHVQPAAAADCALTIQGLSALVYGTHDPADFALRGWGRPDEEVQAAMRALFPPRLPHIHEIF
ncbi:MAG: GNAT family N-acetyltransferase [Chloroflexi bacterium]|nr:GNAT family N-acetyltransferase [Chloroflexota bacterium]MBK7918801.1 GNAT family N-acetyltransferase [Chloroflexota bacterium]MBP7592881.1 GNAT family N-acetyltransferase [Chloroflexota bacterium]